MRTETPTPILLKNYAPPAYFIDKVHLDVDIRNEGTLVSTTLHCTRNPQTPVGTPLVLDGEELETLSICLDGQPLTTTDYNQTLDTLTLSNPPEDFILETQVRIQPDRNTHLSGLYRSQDGYFTQCEAQGFRRITWFTDRPDVMACYTVTLHADKEHFPVLLANGNPVDRGDEPHGRHFATWEDPFKKPCYLFALVAGKLDVLRDSYRTSSGREVQLAIYVEPGKLDQCAHAMAALKKAMIWDEETCGLECDLDHYMIVAVGDFNMGAMENKGLNIFNTKYVLARADVATDMDFINIDRVVAHEYFHNWTGNRVTCRDWFQLSLKEGLTVFRDQEFGADLHSRTTSRIQEVRQLRAAQFPEDAGPMAHPVRPASYVEINNFYTATVYEKGAEVVRMIHTLIGKAAFRQGMALYFSRHDGQAVTCDDFVAAMGDASGFDFTPFMTWYRQAGTPRINARGDYYPEQHRYILSLSQHGAATAGPDASPYLIPVSLGLLGPGGEAMDLGDGQTTRILQLQELRQTFVFENITANPVPSLLRDFSAPVILEYPYTDGELTHLLAHDPDAFNRWEAGQRLFSRLILRAVETASRGQPLTWPASILAATRKVLLNPHGDPAFIAEALTLPGEATLAEQMEMVDPEALHTARCSLAQFLALGLEDEFARLYVALSPTAPYQPEPVEVGRRRLRNLCLAYLNELENPAHRALAYRQFTQADNMTDQFAALSILANAPGGEGPTALEAFYQRWQQEALVVDKWLVAQSGSRLPDTPAKVEALTLHPAFDLKNPNKVYALLRNFGANHRHFHAGDGSGYRFIARQITLLDPINPQVASRLARCFDRWKRFDPIRQGHARQVLTELRQRPGLSRDVLEVVDKALS